MSRVFNNLYLTVTSPQHKTVDDLLADEEKEKNIKKAHNQRFGLNQVGSWEISRD